MKKTKAFDLNLFRVHVQCNIFHINKIKWGPDECSASDFALTSYWLCLDYRSQECNGVPCCFMSACSTSQYNNGQHKISAIIILSKYFLFQEDIILNIYEYFIRQYLNTIFCLKPYVFCSFTKRLFQLKYTALEHILYSSFYQDLKHNRNIQCKLNTIMMN